MKNLPYYLFPGTKLRQLLHCKREMRTTAAFRQKNKIVIVFNSV